MANLTEISISVRKFIIWLVIVFIGYLILRILFSFGIGYWKTTHPVSLPPPNVRFMKIPPPKFSKVATSSSGLKFSLGNIEGRPPEATFTGKVYSMPKKLPSLLTSQRAKNLAVKLGFTAEPEIITPTYYHFVDLQNPLRTFYLDTINMNFKLNYDYNKNPKMFSYGHLSSREQAITEVKSFIQYNNLFDASILGGKITTELLRYDAATKQFISTNSLSTTQLVRVNFFRQDLDGLKIIPPLFSHSYNYALYNPPSSSSPSQIIELSYTFWPIAFDDFATYPLKSSTTAWQDLLDGYATVINMGTNQPDNIIIRNIYLAYYDSEESQTYLQPIFVFEGDNNFVAYLPAIISQWLE